VTAGNIYAYIPPVSPEEAFEPLLDRLGARIERIVSWGQASPPGFWYDQETAEWVMLLRGSAEVRFEGEEAPRVMKPGDYLFIPSHVKHRVERTDESEPTLWLAVHMSGD